MIQKVINSDFSAMVFFSLLVALLVNPTKTAVFARGFIIAKKPKKHDMKCEIKLSIIPLYVYF
jgi:hypothetical protein